MDILPKNNPEAEESLISAVLLENDEFEYCVDLEPEDFYSKKNQVVFEAIKSLISRRDVADLTSVAYELKNNNKLEAAGGAAYLAEIADRSLVSFNPKHHAHVVKDCAKSREVLRETYRLINMLRENKSANELLAYAQDRFLKIEASEAEETVKKVRDVVMDHFDRIEQANKEDAPRGYSTGFPSLDRRLTVRDGKLIIVAGRPKMGKTSLAVSIAKNMDKLGVKTGFLSIEMPESEIMDKFLSMESGIDSAKFNQRKGLRPEDFLTLGEAAYKIQQKSGILLDATGNIDFNGVARRCRKMVREGAQVLFIDQLSQIKGLNEAENKDRFARFSENCNRLARLKKELNVPIFLLAQLNRKLEERKDKEPMMSDLKMTGNLEEDADAIIFLYRPGMYEDTKSLSDEQREFVESKTVVNLAANRHGGVTRTDAVSFDHGTQYFYEERMS